MRYCPFEPEMILQLFGNRFRQWEVTTKRGGKRDFLAPLPDTNHWPNEVQQCMDAGWACNKISLLDFLRKTNGNGQVVDWLPKRTRI